MTFWKSICTANTCSIAAAIAALPPTCVQGQRLKLRLRLATEVGRPGRGVFRVETLNLSGARVAPLSQKLRWAAGSAELDLPVAFNDPVGKWTVRVTDVATGATVEHSLEITAAQGAPNGG